MRDNELVFTATLPQGTNWKTVIQPAEINPLAAEFFEKLGSKIGKPIENTTFVLAGTTHNVPIKSGIAA